MSRDSGPGSTDWGIIPNVVPRYRGIACPYTLSHLKLPSYPDSHRVPHDQARSHQGSVFTGPADGVAEVKFARLGVEAIDAALDGTAKPFPPGTYCIGVSMGGTVYT